jgi:hypothetical protein
MPSVIATTKAMRSLLIDATYREQTKVPPAEHKANRAALIRTDPISLRAGKSSKESDLSDTVRT